MSFLCSNCLPKVYLFLGRYNLTFRFSDFYSLSIFISQPLYLYTSTSLFLFLYLYISLSLNLYLYISQSLYLYLCVFSISTYNSLFLFLSWYIFFSFSISLFPSFSQTSYSLNVQFVTDQLTNSAVMPVLKPREVLTHILIHLKL